MGCSPWGHKESDMTEVTEHANMNICFQLLTVTIGVSFLSSHAISLERSLWPLYSKYPTPYDAVAAVLLLSHVWLFVTSWTVAPPGSSVRGIFPVLE